MSKLIYVIVLSGHSSLQKIGANLPGSIDLESRVKKAKRWLDSKYSDYQTWYLPHIQSLLAGLARKGYLIFVIDGSEIGKDCMALMISVVWKKRALPICWIVKQRKKGHFPASIHVELLEILKCLVPDGCKIFLLGDGEFDNIDIQEFCRNTHWAYVLRTAKNNLIEVQSGEQFPIGDLSPEQGADHWLIEDVYFTKQRYGVINCVVWHCPKHQNPIYLVTNLEYGQEVIELYDQRYNIETIFGDIKSRGFNIHKVKINNPDRLSTLLMIVCIAFLMVFAFGTFDKKLAPYLARFMRKDRVDDYSVFQIGLRGMQHFIKEKIKLFPKFKKKYLKYILKNTQMFLVILL